MSVRRRRGRGAGGSIGTEIVRQITANNPVHLILLDNSEFNLYAIDRELGARFGTVPPEVEARVRAAMDPERLRVALPQILKINSPGELSL